MYDNLKRVAMNELSKLDGAYAGKDEFVDTDAKKFDCLSHGLKCLLTAVAMLEAEEYGYESGNMSGRRGRNPMNGQYVSRDMGPGYSGHYPHEYYPDYPGPRHW